VPEGGQDRFEHAGQRPRADRGGGFADDLLSSLVHPAAVPPGPGQQRRQRCRQFVAYPRADGQVKVAHAVEQEQGPGAVGLARTAGRGPAGEFLEHPVKIAERGVKSAGIGGARGR